MSQRQRKYWPRNLFTVIPKFQQGEIVEPWPVVEEAWPFSRATVILPRILHLLPILHRTLLACQLLQQLCDDLCILIGLLLHSALTQGVQLPKQPHFLQLSNENLEVFCTLDLSKVSKYTAFKSRL